MSTEKLRAWWSHRQGLDGRLASADAKTVIEEVGWARSVAGVGPYFTLFSRAGIRPKQADAAVLRLEIHELPAARGCTYVLPAEDFALGLAAGASFRSAEIRVAEKLGVTYEEIDLLCDAVVTALGNQVLSPDEIRSLTGSSSRSLGEEGKKKGLTTTLPIALGKLQAEGRIRRVPIDGRLDQQRYKYTNWVPNPRAGLKLTDTEIQIELAKRFFSWTGPATLAEFVWFSGLSNGVAKKALTAIDLVELPDLPGRLLLKSHVEAWTEFVTPGEPDYRLVSSLDSISLLRRDLRSLLSDGDEELPVFYGKDFQKLGGLADLPNHAIMDRGRLVGLWEYDTFKQSIAWTAFVPSSEALVKAIETTETMIREDLGDARSFSLDSPKSRIPAVEALRQAQPD